MRRICPFGGGVVLSVESMKVVAIHLYVSLCTVGGAGWGRRVLIEIWTVSQSVFRWLCSPVQCNSVNSIWTWVSRS